MTGPSRDSLVVEPADEDAEPLDSWEGAGLVSSVADLNSAFAEGDGFSVAAAAAGVGLDALGFVVDPLGALAQAGVGWVIEHVWFLHEPLDALAGDPTRIVAAARTWHNVAVQLDAVAAAHRSSAAALPGWDGEAADAYRASVERYAHRLGSVGECAEVLSQLVLATGALIGTERALIRDWIAEFVVLVVEIFALGVVLAFLSAGGSLAAVAAWVVERALALSSGIARQVARLLDVLDEAGGHAAQLATAMRAVPEIQVRAQAWGEVADDLGLPRSVELTKQTLGNREPA